jgi:hypothetical protein
MIVFGRGRPCVNVLDVEITIATRLSFARPAKMQRTPRKKYPLTTRNDRRAVFRFKGIGDYAFFRFCRSAARQGRSTARFCLSGWAGFCPSPLSTARFKGLALGGVDHDGVGRSPVGPVALSFLGWPSRRISRLRHPPNGPASLPPYGKPLRVSHRALPFGYRRCEAGGFR